MEILQPYHAVEIIACEQGEEVSIHLYWQEMNPETYAISKADLILKGEGSEADNMRYGHPLRQHKLRLGMS